MFFYLLAKKKKALNFLFKAFCVFKNYDVFYMLFDNTYYYIDVVFIS